jgi:hypothetical protein
MAIGIQPLGQTARGVVRQAGVDELAMLGIQHRLRAGNAATSFSARRRVMPGFPIRPAAAPDPALAQLGAGRMHIADAHLADLQQVIDGLLVALLLEEMAERTRHFATDVRHALEQRPRQVADQLQVTEPLRQRLGRALADVLDASANSRRSSVAARLASIAAIRLSAHLVAIFFVFHSKLAGCASACARQPDRCHPA